VAADIVEGVQRPIGRAGDDQRLVAGRAGEEVARASQLVDAARQLPGAAEDAFLLELEHGRVEVPA